jgi:hypothetical protein
MSSNGPATREFFARADQVQQEYSCDRQTAIRQVALDDPVLHRKMLREANTSRPHALRQLQGAAD